MGCAGSAARFRRRPKRIKKRQRANQPFGPKKQRNSSDEGGSGKARLGLPQFQAFPDSRRSKLESALLPQPEDLPQGEPDAHPDGDVYEGDDQPEFPPGLQVHVASIKVDGGRPGSIVGDASAQGGESPAGERKGGPAIRSRECRHG